MDLLAEAAIPAALRMAKALLEHRGSLWLEFRCRAMLRRARIRVAMSSILSLKSEGRFILVQNRHRPHEYAPFGGVIKHSRSADGFLREIGFEAHSLDGQASEMERDIRGFIQGSRFPAFMKWFATGVNRESNAIHRELQEEIAEAFVGRPEESPAVSAQLRPIFLWNAQTEFRRPPNQDFYQYRLFQVFELEDGDDARRLRSELTAAAHWCDRLLLATPEEVRRGRAGDAHIAGHTIFLLSKTGESNEPEPLPN